MRAEIELACQQTMCQHENCFVWQMLTRRLHFVNQRQGTFCWLMPDFATKLFPIGNLSYSLVQSWPLWLDILENLLKSFVNWMVVEIGPCVICRPNAGRSKRNGCNFSSRQVTNSFKPWRLQCVLQPKCHLLIASLHALLPSSRSHGCRTDKSPVNNKTLARTQARWSSPETKVGSECTWFWLQMCILQILALNVNSKRLHSLFVSGP
jgi:hypothetical protein